MAPTQHRRNGKRLSKRPKPKGKSRSTSPATARSSTPAFFRKRYPKIKVISVTGSGTDLTRRLAAERRAEKYLADVYNGGGYSLYQNLYLTKGLDSIKSALILPEVTDTSKWWENRHRFVDDENRHIFIYEANVSEGGGPAFNNLQLKPEEYKSYWDFLNPKLKGKIVSLDPRKAQGAGGSWQYLYYHQELGPKFIKRLYGEMDVTYGGGSAPNHRLARKW